MIDMSHCPSPSASPFSTAYLEGQEDVVSRLIMGVIGVIIWLIGGIKLLTKSPDPSSSPSDVQAFERWYSM